MKRIALCCAALAALAIVGACQDESALAEPVAPDTQLFAAAKTPSGVQPTGKGIGTRSYSMGPRTRYRVEYHNGRIMPGPVDVFFIFYGDWGVPGYEPPAMHILVDFVANLQHSSYFNINKLYPDPSGAAFNGSVLYGRSTTNAYSHGTALSDADIEQIVKNSVLTGLLPLVSNGVYVVVGSPDVDVTSGLGSTYCSFHQKTSVLTGFEVNYVFIGHAARNPAQCASQLSGPNGDYAGDAMVGLLATELSNAIVDPSLNAWYDRVGFEPADKCAWDFGPVYQAANGALANVRLGGRDYLLPKLWVPIRNGGYCSMVAPGS